MSNLKETVKDFETQIMKFMHAMSDACLSDVGSIGQVRKHESLKRNV